MPTVPFNPQSIASMYWLIQCIFKKLHKEKATLKKQTNWGYG